MTEPADSDSETDLAGTIDVRTVAEPQPGSPDDRADAPVGGPVRLVIPAQARFLRLARLTAAGLAGDLGYGVDAIEDLRIAVDELCAAIIEDADPGAALHVTYFDDDASLVVEGRCDDLTAPPPQLHRVAQELLAMLADDHEIGADGEGRTFRLVKHRVADR